MKNFIIGQSYFSITAYKIIFANGKCKIWVQGGVVAKHLGYADTDKTIRNHVCRKIRKYIRD